MGGAPVALVSAAGTGGWPCGKTQLAVDAARGLRESGHAEAVVWVGASSRLSVVSGYAAAAAALGLDCSGGAERAAARLAGWLAGADRPWLLVLDDLRDPADIDGLWPPRTTAGRVLVTAATSAAVPAGAGAVVRPVPVYSPREAVEVFTSALSTDPDHRAGALDLVTELGCEPAAIWHAAAVVADSNLTCRGYRQIFTGQRDQLGAAGSPAAAVTWTLAAEHAGLIAPEGGTWPMLVLLGALDGTGIPASVLTSPPACQYLHDTSGIPAGPAQARKLLHALQQAGLAGLRQEADGPAVTVSAALQAAVRDTAGPEAAIAAARVAAEALAAAWPRHRPLPATAAMLGNCAATVRKIAGQDVLLGPQEARPLAWEAGVSLAAAGMPVLAARWWQDLTSAADGAYGSRHTDTLTACAFLADAQLAAGHASDAASRYQQVLAARSQALGPQHPASVATAVSLGRALTACGQPAEAVDVLAAAVTAAGACYGPGHDVTLAAMDDHATACLAAGQPAGAIAICQNLLAARQRYDGPAGPATLAAAARLAAACLAAGQAGDAIGIYEQIAALAAGQPAGLEAGSALAAAYTQAGRIADALTRHESTCTASEQLLGAAHPATLLRRAALARACWDAGQPGTALTVLAAATTTARENLPPGDPVLATLLGLQRDLAGD